MKIGRDHPDVEQPECMELNPHPWRTLWRRWSVVLAFWLAYVPALWVADRLGGEIATAVVGVGGMVAWLILGFRAALAACPRCGGRMPLFPRSPSRACPTCNFPSA